MAIGAAMAGLRPVVELYMAEFMLVAMDQVVNEAPRFRYMSGGQVKVPLVLKAGFGFACGWAGQHTGSLTALFMGVPGLKVVVPSTAADAKGLMATAIRDDNPVVFLHHYLLYSRNGRGAGRRTPGAVRQGRSSPLRRRRHHCGDRLDGCRACSRRPEKLAKEGIHAEVIDPRTVAPLDLETILKSVAKTGRLVLVDQAPRHATVGGIIAGDVAEHGFSSLKAPILQVNARDATVPYSEPLEAYVIPDEERIIAAVRKVLQGRR